MEEAEAREDGFRGQIWKGLKQLSIDGCVSLELLSRQNVNQRVVAGQAWRERICRVESRVSRLVTWEG